MSNHPQHPQKTAKQLGQEIADVIDIANKWKPAVGQPGLTEQALLTKLNADRLDVIAGSVLSTLIASSPNLGQSLANVAMAIPELVALSIKLVTSRTAFDEHNFINRLRSTSDELIEVLRLIITEEKSAHGPPAFIHSALFLMNQLIVVHRKAIDAHPTDKETHLPRNEKWKVMHTGMAETHPQWANLTLDKAHTDFAKHLG